MLATPYMLMFFISVWGKQDLRSVLFKNNVFILGRVRRQYFLQSLVFMICLLYCLFIFNYDVVLRVDLFSGTSSAGSGKTAHNVLVMS